MWTDRNEAIHSLIRKETETMNDAILNVSIRREFTKGKTTIRRQFHYLFDIGPEAVLRRDRNFRSAWLHAILSARQAET